MLGMRYFFVVQTEGILPFHFVEILEEGYKFKGTLKCGEEMKQFWNDNLEIK